MEIGKAKAIIEAILFAAGREVSSKELMVALELSLEDINAIMENIIADYETRGMEIICIQDHFQMVTRKEYYDYIYPVFDKRNKPNLSNAALETLSIIAYNPRITRAEIEAIRGVNSDGTIYKLLEYHLIEEAGKLDAPGRPGTYRVTTEFFKTFGFSNIEELPELPRYKLDENQQIVIDDIIEEYIEPKNTNQDNEIAMVLNEAPMPEREEKEEIIENKEEKE